VIRVSVAAATPARQEVVEIEMAEGATVAEALARSGLQARFPEIDFAAARVGIWSRPCVRDTLLRDGDRVEVYRELEADPKEMRRRRARLKPFP
jgi:putative ubiquitin-RnfH superfamily antitoxin RatB of RatAB toxin-antitoxin module